MVDASKLSQKELEEHFDAFYGNVSKNLYSPAKWAKEHLSPEIVNQNVVSVLCSKVQFEKFDDVP